MYLYFFLKPNRFKDVNKTHKRKKSSCYPEIKPRKRALLLYITSCKTFDEKLNFRTKIKQNEKNLIDNYFMWINFYC